MRPFDVVTFDCYGTLIDWERGIHDAFAALGASLRLPVDADRAVELYVEIEAAVEAEAYRRYRAVLTETARRIAALQTRVARPRWSTSPPSSWMASNSRPSSSICSFEIGSPGW